MLILKLKCKESFSLKYNEFDGLTGDYHYDDEDFGFANKVYPEVQKYNFDTEE